MRSRFGSSHMGITVLRYFCQGSIGQERRAGQGRQGTGGAWRGSPGGAQAGQARAVQAGQGSAGGAEHVGQGMQGRACREPIRQVAPLNREIFYFFFWPSQCPDWTSILPH